MKKRFLLIVLCLTICVVGLPFTASAAEIIGDSIILSGNEIHMARGANCNCGESYILVNYSPTHTEYLVGTAAVCYRRVYPAVRGQCPVCHVLATFYDVSEDFGHRYTNHVKDGVIIVKCGKCGHIQ